VTALHLERSRSACPAVCEGFVVGHTSEDGVEHWTSLAEAWAARFELGVPVRRFTSRKGQRHLSGLWWCATTGGHVGFESWLERDHVMLLDFDAAVVGIASQPLWLRWCDGAGRQVSHVPDFFARHADGSAVVIDCRPAERRPPRDVAKFEATERACSVVGWEYRLVGAADEIVTSNVRWLAGYRHPRHRLPAIAPLLRHAFRTPTPLLAGAQAAGDPIAVLPVLFHLLWCHELSADLSVPLHPDTVVSVAASAR